MKIVLIGFMGSGKSTVGKILASNLGLALVETDHLVLQQSGSISIPEIFMLYGEGYFRRLEEECCCELATLENGVISTGGGIVTGEHNVPNLRKTSSKESKSSVVALTADFNILKERVAAQGELRPLFANEDTARELFIARELLYRKYSDLQIDVSYLSPDEVCKAIIENI